MNERLSTQQKYNQTEERVTRWHEQTGTLADSHMNLARAFRQAWVEAVDDINDAEKVAEFHQRLQAEVVEGDWPDPALLTEIKACNPDSVKGLLDRFQQICEQQRIDYTDKSDKPVGQFTAQQEQGQQIPTESTSRWDRTKALAKATLRGFSTIRL